MPKLKAMWKKKRIQEAVSPASSAINMPVIATSNCEPKETILSTFFNYDAQKRNIYCHAVN